MVQKRSTRNPHSTWDQPLEWGALEIGVMALNIGLCMLLIGALVLGVLDLIGFGSLSQWHGFG